MQENSTQEITETTEIEPTQTLAVLEQDDATALPASPASTETHPAGIDDAGGVDPTGMEQIEPLAEAPHSEPTSVPLSRLQGVQRRLSHVESQLAQAQADVQTLRDQLAQAHQFTAQARINELRATATDIVPELIAGLTLEEVEQSLIRSREAYAAARATYARQIPTPSAGTSAAPTPLDQPRNSTDALRRGLAQTLQPPDLNR